MTVIFRDGRWATILRVSNALHNAGLTVQTDTKGQNGTYWIAIDMRETVAAKRIITELQIATHNASHNGYPV